MLTDKRKVPTAARLLLLSTGFSGKMWVFICMALVLPNIQAKFYKSNITDFSRCKVHYSRSQGSYKEFYEIADESRENDTILDFHFSVLAPSDAHILLSPSSKLQRSDPAYEIVLGAGGNVFSDIRRAQKSAVKASVRLKDVLSALDIHSFWLHVSKDGLIEVGREGEELAFLSWQDPDPLPLKYFSFGTWPGVEAKWFYDCPREDDVKRNSKEAEPTLSEQLRLHLLRYYDHYVRPVLDFTDLTVVTMQLVLNYVSLDEYKSALNVKGIMKLTWTDEKLHWNPEDYAGIKSMHIVGREIWRPDVVLYNAVDLMGRDILDQSLMVVTSDGLVQWTPPANIKVWCDASDLGSWPSDSHSCEIILGFWADYNYLQLQFDDVGNKILGEQFKTEWDILKVTAVSNFGWNYTSATEYSNNSDPPFLKLIFEMKRHSSVYSAVFFAPFLVISIAMLATFCMSPFGHLKISLGCLQLIMTSIVLVNLASFLPVHPEKVPYLVLLYSFSCFGSVVCILISILVINLSRSKYKQALPHYLWKILMSFPVQTLLLLPKIEISEDYGKLDEIFATKQDGSIQNTWILFGKAIDRIAFIIYFILIMFALTVKC